MIVKLILECFVSQTLAHENSEMKYKKEKMRRVNIERSTAGRKKWPSGLVAARAYRPPEVATPEAGDECQGSRVILLFLNYF